MKKRYSISEIRRIGYERNAKGEFYRIEYIDGHVEMRKLRVWISRKRNHYGLDGKTSKQFKG
jgi:hypothetical protein